MQINHEEHLRKEHYNEIVENIKAVRVKRTYYVQRNKGKYILCKPEDIIL